MPVQETSELEQQTDPQQDRIKDALLAILDGVEHEDEYLRLQQMREFKKHNLFWHGFQYLFWSDQDMDWRIPTHEEFEEVSGREETKWIFDYVINHFKAHGESIIAALSADIPDVRFGPRDAADPSDRRAVDAASYAADLIEKWNRAKQLIINALFYLCTEGFVASYTYNKKDESYGTVNIQEYGLQMAQTTPDMIKCPSCGYTEPADESVHSANEPCPDCGAPLEVEPGMQEQVPFMSGERPVPKGREIIEVYGPLNVRVPSYVTKQADAGYLVHYVDADPALFKEAFPNVADQIDSDPGQSYERLMRQSSLTMDGYQLNIKLATQKKCWFRPWMVNRLDDQFDDIKGVLRQQFKTGIYCSFIGQTLCESRDESMDKHWTLTKAGPSKGVHADPLLKSLVPLQEMRNNLQNLFVMQVEYGVPATYADTEVFDFEGQQKQEVSPGYIYPVTPRPGQSIDSAFYSEKTTTLSKEATQLLSSLTGDEQFCSGDYPSIYGGPNVSGSKTLGEYDKSRAFALQRLSLTWYFLDVWWGETIHKSVISFIDHQLEDEPLTVKSPGGFQTRWIRQADFEGSFDRLEPEASADFPVSFSQKRSTLMALAQLNNPDINSVLFSSENAGIVQKYVGLTELKIPGDIQRNKQLYEILVLIGLEPQDDGQGGMMSPVPIEPDIDDHQIHIEVCIDFLAGDTGQDLKRYNPQGYASVMTHLIEHKQAVQAAMAPPMGAPGPIPGKGIPPQPKINPQPIGPPPPEAVTTPGGIQ